jgi:hypothetical protein
MAVPLKFDTIAQVAHGIVVAVTVGALVMVGV